MIMGADGKQVASIENLRGIIAAHRPGGAIRMQIYRGGKQQTVTVTLGRQPATPS
jgi:S1-C subfamily serine protease